MSDQGQEPANDKPDGKKEEVKQATEQTGAPRDTDAAPRKKTKVTQMTLPQVEAALEEVRKRMGGYHSRYARHLLSRRDMLTGEGGPAVQRAA